MVLGLSGTGKTTLINYLSSIPLVCFKEDGEWKLDLKDPNITLPGGFGIGHGSKSKTLYPSIYSPPNEEFSYVDNPGFRDSRGIEVEISNSYFRKEILNQVDHIKFLILISHFTLKNRGNQFRDSIKRFSDFLGIFDRENSTDSLHLKQLSKSIGIIISRVDNDGESDEQMIKFFKKKLLDILDEEKEKENDNLTVMQDFVFRQAIENNQIKIFSNPKKRIVLDNKQSLEILNLIDNLSYIDKKYLDIRTYIEDSYFKKLLKYTQNKYRMFEKNLTFTLTQSLIKYYDKEAINLKSIKEIKSVYVWLDKLANKDKLNVKVNQLLNYFNDETVLNTSDKEYILRIENYIRFFIDLIPNNTRDDLVMDKNWINLDLNNQINNLKSDLKQNILNKQYEYLIQNIESFLMSSFEIKFHFDQINFDDYDIQMYVSLYEELNYIEKKFFNSKNEIKTIMNYLNQTIKELNQTNITKIINNVDDFKDFTVYLHDKEIDKLYVFNKEWINKNILDKSNQFKKYLINCFEKLFKRFKIKVESLFDSAVWEYFNSELEKINYINDTNKLKIFFEKIKSKIVESNELEIINEELTKHKILNESIKIEINKLYADLKRFINVIPKSKLYSIENIKDKLINNQNNAVMEIKNFDKTETTFNDGVYTYKGHFSKISLIIDQINQDESIKDLKNVKIFSTHLIIFDQNYKINIKRYKDNAPDLIIISPKVIFKNNVEINLSCERIPNYPDNQEKASEVYGKGADGNHGKPGLPGYNGGSLIILADLIVDSSKLTFISQPGQGGPGQNGGDGNEGIKGQNAMHSSVDFFHSSLEFYCKDWNGIKLIDSWKCSFLHASWWRKEGSPGGKGGNGGKGGSAGFNGFGGEAILIEKKTNLRKDNFKTEQIQFKNAQTGKPGEPGLGGYYGDFAFKTYYKNNHFFGAGPWQWIDDKFFSTRCSYDRFDKYDRYYGDTNLKEPNLEDCGRTRDSDELVLDAFLCKRKHELGDKTESNNLRGENGFIQNQNDLNTKDQSLPISKQNINLYKLENDFISYLFGIKNRFSNSKIIDKVLTKFMRNSSQIEPQINDLLERSYILNRNSEIDNYISSLYQEILFISNKYSNNKEKIVLGYLKAFLNSINSRENSLREKPLIIDIKKYIEIIKSNLKELNELKKDKIRELYRSNYQDNLNMKINESNEVIANLKNDILSSQHEMNNKIINAVQEIRKLQDDVRNDTNRLIQEKIKLEKALLMKTLLGVLDVAAQGLSFLGPKAALLGSLTQIGLNAARSSEIGDPRKSGSMVPATVDKVISDLKDSLKKENELELKKLEKEISIVETKNDIINKKQISFSQINAISLINRIEKLPTSREKDVIEFKYYQIMISSTETNSNSEEKKKYEQKYNDAKKKLEENVDKINKVLVKTISAARTAQLAYDVYKDVKLTKNEIEMIQNEIEKNGEKYQDLYKLEEKLNIHQSTVLKDSNDELILMSNNLKNPNQSKISLEYIKYDIKNIINKMKNDLMNLVGSLEKGKSTDISTSIFRIEHSFSTIIQIYSHIQSYKEQNDFADYIASLHVKEANFVVDKKYEENLNKLKQSILENIIIERYEQAKKAYKDWSYPFYDEYSKSFINEQYYQNDIQSLLRISSENLDIIYQKIEMYDYLIHDKIQGFIQNYVFEKETVPFYEWSSKMFPISINQLLSGFNTTLYADVNKVFKFDVVKFRKLFIKIELKSNNDQLNTKLNRLLENCFVELKYSGSSYYRYKNEISEINLNNQNLIFRYRYGHINDTNYSNEIYHTFEKRKALLSPYTLWNVRISPLKHVSSNIKIYEEISNVLNQDQNAEIVVYLCGNGQYLEMN